MLSSGCLIKDHIKCGYATIISAFGLGELPIRFFPNHAVLASSHNSFCLRANNFFVKI